MRKTVVYIIVLSTIISFTSVSKAQNASDPATKFMHEAGFGKSNFVMGQNLSPWGVHHRANYNSGSIVYLQANYIFNDRGILGVRCDLMGTAANYVIEEGLRVSDNVNIMYFALQTGGINTYSTRYSLSMLAGVGYALYQSYGLLEFEEYNIYSHMLGLNLDLSFDFMLGSKSSIGCKSSVFTSLSNKFQREIGGKKDNLKMDKTNQLFPNIVTASIFLRRYF
ncbi:MAG: hypothetical protein FWH18_03865 [Marinilabiliaceae bacterium]|nr:hypothetical protein [Marinilabiliaceae bacterium]